MSSTVSLAGYRGHDVVLYFNEGVGCDTCFYQMREFEQHAAQLHKAGITILPIVMNPASQVRPELTAFGLHTPYLIDTTGAVSRAHGLLGKGMHAGLPGHGFVLIDAKGTQRWYGEYPSMCLPTSGLLQQVKAHLGKWSAWRPVTRAATQSQVTNVPSSGCSWSQRHPTSAHTIYLQGVYAMDVKDIGANEEASPMPVLASNFWPWFWALTLAGAAVTAVLSLVVGLMAERRAGHRAHTGPPSGTPALGAGYARAIQSAPVRRELRPLARR